MGQSISRLFTEVAEPPHQQAARAIRQILAICADVADLVQVGAYTPGAAPHVDKALALLPSVNSFLQQEQDQHVGFDETLEAMQAIANAWNT